MRENFTHQIVELLKKGNCVPQIMRLAKLTKKSGSTVKYHIDKLRREGALITCKAVFDNEKVGMGFTGYILISLDKNTYDNPESVARRIAKIESVESVDIVTGEWELIAKVRTEKKGDYYKLLRGLLKIEGVSKTYSLISLKEVKENFIVKD